MIHRDFFLAYVKLPKVLDGARTIVLRGGSKTQAEPCSLTSGIIPKRELLSMEGKETA